MAISVSEKMTQTLTGVKTMVVADIETTGFGGNKYDDITQIAACLVDLDSGRIKRSFNRYCQLRHKKHVPEDVVKLTGITNELLLEKGSPVDEVLRDFMQFVGGEPLLFHNYAFDWRKFLFPEMTRIGINPTNTVLCSLLISRGLLKGTENEPSGFKLEDLVTYFGGTIQNAHDASYDCKYTASVARKLKELAISNQAAIEMAPVAAAEPVLYNLNNMIIKSVHYWSKYGKERIYVTCTAGRIFYDVQAQAWQATDLFSGSIDWDGFQDIVLRYAQVDDMPGLINKCKGIQIRKESLSKNLPIQNNSPAPAPSSTEDKPVVTIYTNSIFSDSTGNGSWGSILVCGKAERTMQGSVPHATEEAVKLTALLATVRRLTKPCLLQINMDARSIVEPLRQGWVFAWKQNGWRKASQKPVENVELWDSLLTAIEPHEFTCCNLKGQVSDRYHERCTELAMTAM